MLLPPVRLGSLSIGIALMLFSVPHAYAELTMSPIFGDSMVMQRDQPIHVWGWTTPQTKVSVEMAGHEGTGQSDASGRFDVKLDALPAGGPHQLVVHADQSRTFSDVLIGEVWVCSGQSNMSFSVGQSDDGDIEALAANHPQIRLISVPNRAAQEPKNSFKGAWQSCSPKSARDFSAVGYFYGRQLHQTLGVPVGLIDNAWGGSAAEAWVPREILAENDGYKKLLAHWDGVAKSYRHQDELTKWNDAVAAWKAAGSKGRQPRRPGNRLQGNKRPGNLYNGCLHPVIGYTIRGVIWYQGESNASRAQQYRELFPLMIQTWRDKWQQGDFPFYWVQLADFRAEAAKPGPSTWAELREAQTMTMERLPQTGQAVITDLGEAKDIHPRNKQDVAKRLSRWALAKDYGFDSLHHQSPTFDSLEIKGGKALLKFKHVGGGLITFDVHQVKGFTMAGEDRKFVSATAKIVSKNTVEVSAKGIQDPRSVRFGWDDNPVVNVQSKEGLPLTPFRTDQWPGVTDGADLR